VSYRTVRSYHGLTLAGRLTISPIPELASLHVPGSRRYIASPAFAAAETTTTPIAKGPLLELQLNCTGTPSANHSATDISIHEKGAAAVVGLEVLSSSDRRFFTTIGFNYSSGRLFVDHTNSGRNFTSGIVQTAPLPGGHGEAAAAAAGGGGVQLYILVDHALIESFLNRRAVITSWISELMSEPAPGGAPGAGGAEERAVYALPAPAGVACTFSSAELTALQPVR
jgi:sucrose-6-phosphate hydrolase SacC (GH32 family)